jgi:hypothetical protein
MAPERFGGPGGAEHERSGGGIVFGPNEGAGLAFDGDAVAGFGHAGDHARAR